MTGTRPLPPSRGLMAVDVTAFSGNGSVDQPDLSASIPALIGRAFDRCELPDVWAERRFPQGTGDGYLFGVPENRTPYLVAPLLDALQQVLEEEDERLRARDRNLRLRLRAAVHLGAVPDEGDPRDGIGTPTNETFRLLDSTPVRKAIKSSDPDVTMLAAIVSQRIFEDIVRAGYTPTLPPSRFEQVTAEVVDKGFVAPAWLHVPRPSSSGEPAADHTGGPGTPEGAAKQAPTGSTSTTIHGNVGNNISGGSFSGGNFRIGGGS